MTPELIYSAFSTLEDIGSTTSRTQKEQLLKDGDNTVLTNLLYATYNPYLMYYIKKMPKVTVAQKKVPSEDNYDLFYNLIIDLSSRNITGNNAINAVKQFLEGCTAVEAKWYSKVLQKDLKIGVTESTINKVFPNLVPEFSCQLAHPFKKFPNRFVVDRKLDGYRCLAFVKYDGTVELRTRNGKLIEGYDGIEFDIANLPRGYVYDGEIMARTGSFADTQSQVFKKGAKNKDGVLNIFDVVPIKEFEQGGSKHTLYSRLIFLNEIEDLIQNSNSLSRVIPSDFLNGDNDAHIAFELHRIYTEEGYEGTMVKDLDMRYECRRTNAVQKIKDIFTIDLVVVDVEEGKAGTKNEGKLGALIVALSDKEIYEQLPESQHKNAQKGTFLVNIGGGYSDEQRELFWKNKEDMINKVIEIEFQEVTKDKNKEHSLRFPRFKLIREDKS